MSLIQKSTRATHFMVLFSKNLRGQNIKNKSSIINRSRPQSVASSLIYFFLCKIKGANNVNIKDFVKKVKLSELTINKIVKEIESII